MTNIKPLGTLILVKKIEETEKTTASGLVLTASAQDAEPFNHSLYTRSYK